MKYKVIKAVVNKHGVAGNVAEEELIKSETDVVSLIHASITKPNAIVHVTIMGGKLSLFRIDIQSKETAISYKGEILDGND